jgi:hypothetical protein
MGRLMSSDILAVLDSVRGTSDSASSVRLKGPIRRSRPGSGAAEGVGRVKGAKRDRSHAQHATFGASPTLGDTGTDDLKSSSLL